MYLFCMEVRGEFEHGMWGTGAGGVVELVINLLNLARSVFVPALALGPGPRPGGPVSQLHLDPGTSGGPSVRADSSHPPGR
jgi:hypothetical protein